MLEQWCEICHLKSTFSAFCALAGIKQKNKSSAVKYFMAFSKCLPIMDVGYRSNLKIKSYFEALGYGLTPHCNKDQLA
jgi:hypothetical protein